MVPTRVRWFILASVAVGWASTASAISTYYTNECSACHGTATPTCNGCHSHGVHSTSAKTDINLAGALSGSTFAPGDTVTVTVNGGYKNGWLRVVLLDENMQELARSSCAAAGASGPPQGCTTSQYPITLSHGAPSTAGAHTWAIAWYGNKRDATGASFGTGTTTTLTAGAWRDDPNNSGHGWQVVALNSFTVSGSTTGGGTTTTGGGTTTTGGDTGTTPTPTTTTSKSSGGCNTGQGSAGVAGLLVIGALAATRRWRGLRAKR